MQPKKAGGRDHPANLVSLCTYCHAQVEAFYWMTYGRKCRKVTDAMVLVLQKIKDRSIDIKPARQLVNIGWVLILETMDYQHQDWQQLYRAAKSWIPTTVRLRDVPVGSALLETPWWRMRAAAPRGEP